MVWVVVFGVDGRVWTGLFSAAPCSGLSGQRDCAGGGNCGGGASCILARAGVEWRAAGFKRASGDQRGRGDWMDAADEYVGCGVAGAEEIDRMGEGKRA